jgi:3-deoxy-D-manno-octulosonate 8-phosphate phosphatase (KDO 8-P phosphatase)
MTYLAELDAILSSTRADLAQIKLIVFDVDGVLTNGQLYFSEQGESTKVFHVRDGVGLKLLSDMGVAVAVMTAKDSAMVRERMTQLGVRHYFPGVADKSALLTEVAGQLSVALEYVGYVGDDMVDLKPMSQSGVSICPADAYGLVRDVADLVLPLSGGEGVARLVCDLILQAKGQFEQAYQLSTMPEFERKR